MPGSRAEAWTLVRRLAAFAQSGLSGAMGCTQLINMDLDKFLIGPAPIIGMNRNPQLALRAMSCLILGAPLKSSGPAGPNLSRAASLKPHSFWPIKGMHGRSLAWDSPRGEIHGAISSGKASRRTR